MTRKRFIKLLMASGFQRNLAHDTARAAQRTGKPYRAVWEEAEATVAAEGVTMWAAVLGVVYRLPERKTVIVPGGHEEEARKAVAPVALEMARELRRVTEKPAKTREEGIAVVAEAMKIIGEAVNRAAEALHNYFDAIMERAGKGANVAAAKPIHLANRRQRNRVENGKRAIQLHHLLREDIRRASTNRILYSRHDRSRY